MQAACAGHLDVIRELLKHSAVVDAQDDSGETALAVAASAGHAECVTALLRAGATAPEAAQRAREAAAKLEEAEAEQEARTNAMMAELIKEELEQQVSTASMAQSASRSRKKRRQKKARQAGVPPPDPSAGSFSSTLRQLAEVGAAMERLAVAPAKQEAVEEDLPEEFVCPITTEAMVDPVVTVRAPSPCFAGASSARLIWFARAFGRPTGSAMSAGRSWTGSRRTTPHRSRVRRSRAHPQPRTAHLHPESCCCVTPARLRQGARLSAVAVMLSLPLAAAASADRCVFVSNDHGDALHEWLRGTAAAAR